MPAPKAKRPANPKAHPASTKPVSAKRATRLREPARTARKVTTGETEVFVGPGYQFVGFRFMCRNRHARH
jgi:hypothetical protein